MLPARRRAQGAAREEAARVADLEARIEQLREAVTAHAEVDQAIGVVIVVGGCSPAEAWDVLREISMRTNTKLRLVARRLIDWPRSHELDPLIRAELERQLARRGRPAARRFTSQPY
ncbi:MULTISPECIES: ANTAR domain-containing protein [unclassified Streptomyces]|uniref:ANTAR domain-containing protein n=1 Tax=unclassified Streptomyces TaxID=2593676 RepID=UPI00278C8D1A|nr:MULTISPECIES: ANTAR domain-containing protein [unclassified Streptomyces]